MRDKPLVLLVDDEMNFLEIISMKLSASGFDPVVAHSAAEAAHAAEKLQPDLILMDIHMPGETGTDAALTIKQNPATKDIKVIFLSSLKDPWPATGASRETIAKELDVEEFIDKSEDLNAIVAKVKKALGMR